MRSLLSLFLPAEPRGGNGMMHEVSRAADRLQTEGVLLERDLERMARERNPLAALVRNVREAQRGSGGP